VIGVVVLAVGWMGRKISLLPTLNKTVNLLRYIKLEKATLLISFSIFPPRIALVKLGVFQSGENYRLIPYIY
jgi:hypothetical protein